MAGFLLDTNHLSEAIRRVSPLRDQLHQTHRQGLRIGTCMPVLCELEAGIQQTKHPQDYRGVLDRLLREVRIWPIDREVAQLYGELFLDLEQRGRALSHVDIVQAALAKHMNLTVLTTDQDFEAVPEIRTQNWLT